MHLFPMQNTLSRYIMRWYYHTLHIAWNDGSSTILNKLTKLQRRAVRLVTGQTYDLRSTQIL